MLLFLRLCGKYKRAKKEQAGTKSRKEGRKEGRKGGIKEERRGGRKAGRQEGRQAENRQRQTETDNILTLTSAV